MITRRRIVTALGAGALVAPLMAFAQQARKYRIGWLANDPDPRKDSLTFKAFKDQLQQLGLVEHRNAEIIIETISGQSELLPDRVARLLRAKVDIIVTGSSVSTIAAKSATQSVPIVFASVTYPVEQKIVASFARPGGNVTGLALEELGSKRLELLQQLLPRARRCARLYDHRSLTEVQPLIIRDYDAASKALGVTVQHIAVKDLQDIESEISAAGRNRFDAMILTAGPAFAGNRERIGRLTLEHRVPAMCSDGRFADAGALTSYSERFPERYRKAAILVDQILRGGRKPADIPVERPMDYELVVNLKTAKALGIPLPLPDIFTVQVNRTIE